MDGRQYVFILGAGRSGTKILRSCLANASDVSAIPYDVGYVWLYGSQFGHDELMPCQLTDKKKKFIVTTLSKFASRASKNGEYTIVLEKSVPNSLRPLYLKAVFPEAKFIHLVRDGRDVIESSMRNWKNPSDKGYFLDKLRYFPLYNAVYAFWYLRNRLVSRVGVSEQALWGPKYKGIESDRKKFDLLYVCTQQWMKCVKVCVEQLAVMDSKDVFNLRYEDFLREPSKVAEVCEFIGCKDTESVLDYYEKNVGTKFQYQSGKAKLNQRDLNFIDKMAGPLLRSLGYTISV